MVLRLASRLEVPLRERNALLVAAGYAPMYRERPMSDPHMASARRAVDLVLKAHEPFPALAIDRHWNLVNANAGVAPLLVGADPSLLQAPINVLRLSLHPQGMAPRILNLLQWARHVFERLRQQIAATSDPVLMALLEELQAYVPLDAHIHGEAGNEVDSVVVPLRLSAGIASYSFISTTMVFGSPVDVTLQELAIESFFPADEATAAAFRSLAR
ncbi:MAG: family transcriptional regulator [Rhizobacter sp.]|nr:family transcriptional regulator [Rhizobacter sp.]